VPGGRYLVTAGDRLLSVWDLGYVSTADCKLVASVGLRDVFEFCMVQATPDGKGLIILLPYGNNRLSIFEIYPQSKIPLLTQIARLDWFPSEEYPVHLLPDTLICIAFHENNPFHENRVVFRVVDYRTNYSTCFLADVDVGFQFKTFATKTAIIVFCKEEILIWAIPPLSPQPSDLRHHLDNNPSHIPPLFKIPFPDGIVHTHDIREWMTASSWYFGSWESVYFNILYMDSHLQKFKIIIKPDLSDASLHVINMSEIISDDLMKSLAYNWNREGSRICEDSLVYFKFWNNRFYKLWEVWSELTGTAPLTNFVTRSNGPVESLCPASGRFVYCILCTNASNGSFIVIAEWL